MKTIVALVILFNLSNDCRAKWLCDRLYGDEGERHESTDTVEVTGITDPTESALHGCIYKGEGMSTGTQAFQFIMKGNGGYNSVGVTSQDDLATGQLLRYFYNGDLNSGEETLQPYFGDKINYYNDSRDETVTFYVSLANRKMMVYIQHDKTPLGLAFNIENQNLPLYPTVLFRGNGKVTMKIIDDPTSFNTERKATTCGGKYELSKFSEAGQEKEIHCVNKGITLSTVLFGIVDEESEKTEAEGYYVTFNNNKNRGELIKDDGEWTYIHVEGPSEPADDPDGTEHSTCIRFIINVLQNVKDVTCEPRKLILTKNSNSEHSIRKDGSKKDISFEAEKLSEETFNPVTKNVFSDVSNA